MKKIKDKIRLSSELRNGLFVFFLLVLFGTVFYHYAENWSIVDAMYFSVITMATVGFGDLYPTTELSKIFTMVYVLVGVGFFLYLFSSITEHFFKEEKEEIIKMDHIMEHIEDILEHKEKKADK